MPPVITIWNSTDTAELTTIAFTGVVPGVESTPQEIHIWNGKGAGSGDSMRSGRLVVYARKPTIGDPDPPWQSTGLPILDRLQIRAALTGAQGNAEVIVGGKVAIGANAGLALQTVPYDSCVEVAVSVLTASSATVQSVEIKFEIEDQSAAPLAEGIYEAFGNGVVLGNGDQTSTGIFYISAAPAETGAAETWEQGRVAGIYQGAPVASEADTWDLSDDLDGSAVALASGEAFYALYTLGASGMTETRGDKAAAPLGVADRPATPLEEAPYALIRKRFGANIDNTDVTDISVLGFAGINRVSGLDVYLGSLTAMVGGFMPRSVAEQTAATMTDNATSRLYLLPDGSTEVDSSGVRAMPLWDITAATGAITVRTDLRRYIGEQLLFREFKASEIAPDSSAYFVNPHNRPMHLLPFGALSAGLDLIPSTGLLGISGNWEVDLEVLTAGTYVSVLSETLKIAYNSTVATSTACFATTLVIQPGAVCRFRIVSVAVSTNAAESLTIGMRYFLA